MNWKEKRRHLFIYIKYMIPSLFDLSVYSICSMISGMMTSKWINATAMGAVSVASPYVSFIYAYGLIYGVGGATVVSVYRGRGEEETAKKAFTLNLTFMVATILAIAAAAFLFANQLARLLGATPENMEYVIQYLRITALFTLPYGFSYSLSMLLKADGHPLVGLAGSAAASGTNLILLFVLVKVMHMDIAGVALATAMAQVVLSIIYFSHFLTKRSTLKLVRFTFSWKEIGRIVQLGIPDALSEASSGVFAIIFNYLAFRTMGEDGIVIFSIINYINLLAVQMLLGATQGMQPLVSFAKGKKDPALCKLYLRFARIFSIVIVAAIFSICVFGTDWVVSGFISPVDTHIYAQARRALLIFSGSLIPVGFNIVSIGYFSAMELPKYSQFLSLFRGSVGITLIGILLAALLGETGIWLAPAVSEGVSAAITLRLFARGKAKAGLVC